MIKRDKAQLAFAATKKLNSDKVLIRIGGQQTLLGAHRRTFVRVTLTKLKKLPKQFIFDELNEEPICI
jgi:hypothetical protein